MRFDDFDKQMRIYEESLDQCIIPDMYIVARLDGRSFTRLTKEVCKFEAPFDPVFRDLMVNTTKHIMEKSGFQITYGFTQSDEISLLFTRDENTFNRKVRKINTTLAGEASAVFSLELGKPAAFDCRVVPLPNEERVSDYFRWRQEDAHRNALNSWCYWTLRRDGKTAGMEKLPAQLQKLWRTREHLIKMRCFSSMGLISMISQTGKNAVRESMFRKWREKVSIH